MDDITEKLLYGQKILVRALPKSGRSTLLEAISRRYAEISGHDSVVVRYGDGQAPEMVVKQVEDRVAAASSAALLIDDWGNFLRSAPKESWQPRLNNLCVDGPFARTIGVLMTASAAENLSRTAACGSPLVDAVHEVRGMPVPEASFVIEELEHRGLHRDSAQSLVEHFGGHRDLLRAAEEGDPEAQIRRSVLQVAAKVGHDGAARILDLGRKAGLHLARQSIDEFLVPAVYAPEAGRTALLPSLLDGGLVKLLPGAGDSWPSKQELSADRLLTRFMSGEDAFWFDRYLYSALPELLDVLRAVAASAFAEMTLRLLSGPPTAGFRPEPVVAAFERFRADGLIVYWHQVAYGDIHPMHDRQLLFRSSIDGYHLPPADRIVGRVAPGNENDAYLARAPLGRMESAWRRSSCWACASGDRRH
ncbi:MAG TPA: hypothetical protein VGH11_08275 [Jatrophihabitans sp.]